MAAVDGNETEAFEAFVRTAGPRLLRVATVLTSDHAQAQDLVQTSLTQVWRSWRRIEGDPYGYARVTLLRAHLAAHRRRWWGEIPTDRLPDPPALHDWHDRTSLHAAVRALPAAQRAVIVCRYLEDLSITQTAAALGIREGTVKSHAARALATLRVDPRLGDEEPRDPARTTTGGAL